MMHWTDIAVAGIAFALFLGIKPFTLWLYRKNRIDDIDAEWPELFEEERDAPKRRVKR